MARRMRCSDAGYVYHVLNRAVGRSTLFDKPPDYAAFEKVLRQAWERSGMRLVSNLVMPNHWHLVVWPDRDGQLSEWAQWLTVTHVRRWHTHHHTEGTGRWATGRLGDWADLPRAVQVVSDPGGRALLRGLPLRRAKCVAGEFGGAGRGLALVKSLASPSRNARSVAGRWPAAVAERLDCACQCGTDRSRTDCAAPQRVARRSLRRGILATTHGGRAGPRIRVPAKGPTPKEEREYLT